jgi:3-hydroxyisobutyrate dehydrogenase-like beta-hydroxyacid dehydrogenase
MLKGELQMRADIGWIGLGNMGSRMTKNLIKAGYTLCIYDIDQEKVRELEALGAIAVASPKEVANHANTVISMIPNDKVLVHVVKGENGVISSGNQNLCYIDMSTVSCSVSEQVAKELEAKGYTYLRAPVSGSIHLAEKGELNFFISGPKEVFLEKDPIFRALGKKVNYVGSNDEARVVKLMINIMVGLNNAAIGEALAFGRKNGLEWEAMIDMISNSVASSPYFSSKIELLKKRDWTPAAPISLIAKDFDLALEVGKESDVPMPFTAIARQFLSVMEAKGKENQDMVSIVTLFDENN